MIVLVKPTLFFIDGKTLFVCDINDLKGLTLNVGDKFVADNDEYICSGIGTNSIGSDKTKVSFSGRKI